MFINWKKRGVVIFLILIILGALWYIFYFPQDCGSDQGCFNEALSSCKRAKLTTIEQGNTYLYQIKGSKRGNCIVDIELKKLYSASYDLVGLLEGKSMKCTVPKDAILFEQGVESTINYCTGPLKEAMYEVIIQRLYNLIAQEMGDVVVEFQESINK